MKKIDIVYLAKQNIKAKKFRSLGIVLGIAISSATLFISIILLLSMQNSLALGIAQLGADIVVLPAQAEPPVQGTLLTSKPSIYYMSSAYRSKIKAIEGVSTVSPRVYLETANAKCCFRPGIFIVGFDPGTDPIIQPWIKKLLKRNLEPFEILTGSGYDWIPGSKIKVYGVPFTIAAKIPTTGVKYFDKAIFIPIDTLYWLSERSRKYSDVVDMNLNQGDVSAYLIQIKPGFTPVNVAEKINFYFPELKAYPAQQFIGNTKNNMLALLKGLVIMSSFTWVTAIILVAVILSITVNERKREFGILRALGASKRFIFGDIIVEAYILATLGSIIGIGIGYAFLLSFINYLVESLRMPYILPSFLYVAIISVIIIDISLFLSSLASFYPAYKSAELEPYDAIRAGE